MAKYPKVATGKKYGGLEVLAPAPKRGTQAYWLCRCQCGVAKEVRGSELRSGIQTSCGCHCVSSRKASETLLAKPAAERVAKGRAAIAARWNQAAS